MIVAHELEIEFQRQLQDSLNLDRTGRELAHLLLPFNWRRTRAGFDVEGHRWRRYKAKGYEKKKRAYGRGKDDWIILTGALKSGLKLIYKGSTIRGKAISMHFQYQIPSDQKKKIEGLLSNVGHDRTGKTYPKSAYKFLGLSKAGYWKRAETRLIQRVLKKNSGGNLK